MEERMKELINVIIPIYNAAAYMDRCMESLTNQTYHNLRIILVDDCSKDDSAQKCDEWAQKDSRIVVHKQKINSGAAGARNAGLGYVDFSGGYVAFVDSDDYIHPKCFEKMYELLNENNVDIVWADVINTHEPQGFDYDESSFSTYKKEVYTSKDVLMREEWRIMYSMAWGKLYKAHLWKDVRFLESCRYFEDGATVFKALYTAEKILKTNIKLYYYYYSPVSSTRSDISEEKCRCGLLTCTEKLDFYKEKNEKDLLDMAYVGYVNIILKNIGRSRYCENPKALRIEMKKLYKNNYMKAVNNKALPLAQRIKYIIYRICPDAQEIYVSLKMKLKH